MNTPKMNGASSEKLITKSLSALERSIKKSYLNVLSEMRKAEMGQIECLVNTAKTLNDIRLDVARLAQKRDTIENLQIQSELHRLANDTMKVIDEPQNYYGAKSCLAQVLRALVSTEEHLATYISNSENKNGNGFLRSIVIRADLLYQAYLSLFPAERMLVISGWKEAGNLQLGAVFDVTGEFSAGHVRADPTRLGRALIAMDMTGTHLAAWFHSHPGESMETTSPSTIDMHQYSDWIRDFSPSLLCAIFVETGWIRFWGQTLKSDQVCIRPSESRITKEQNHEHIYRIARP